MNTIELDSIQSTDRVMDWHDQIFIPVHLRHSVGMDQIGPDGEFADENTTNLLIFRDEALTDLNE